MTKTLPVIRAWHNTYFATAPGPGTSYAVVAPSWASGAETCIDTQGAKQISIQVNAPATVTGTSPTMDVRVEHSNDGENWTTLYDFPQWTTNGTKMFTMPNPSGTDPQACGRYLRFQAKVGGTSPSFPNVSAFVSLKE